MLLRPEEPEAAGWTVMRIEELVGLMGVALANRAVISIDGRSSSGKTTLATRIAARVAGAAVVHTDDIAWWHSRFDWSDLAVEGVLEPFRSGRDVSFRPPAWDARSREGSIDVPSATRLLIMEGVGSSRRELRSLLDAVIWVQSDEGAIADRNAARVGAGEISESGQAGWMEEEIPFLALDRPWGRATAVVAGTPDLVYDPASEVVVARS